MSGAGCRQAVWLCCPRVAAACVVYRTAAAPASRAAVAGKPCQLVLGRSPARCQGPGPGSPWHRWLPMEPMGSSMWPPRPLHCSCWMFPWASPLFLFWGCNKPCFSPPELLDSGALWTYVSLTYFMSASIPIGQIDGSSHQLSNTCMGNPYLHQHTHTQI